MNCFREYIKYVTLNVLGMIGLSCYILADTFFVAQGLGSSGLAALNLAIPIYSFIHGVGLMLGIGGAARYSMQRGRDQGRDIDEQSRQKNQAENMNHTKQNSGERERQSNRNSTHTGSQNHQSNRNSAHTGSQNHQSDRIFTHTIILGSCFAVIFVLAGLFGSNMLTSVLGADTEVFEMCETYLKVMLLFSPAILLNDIILCFVRNDGAPQLSMAAMLTGSISNIILDFVFIFIFDMGIFGAVFATGLAPVISLMVMSRFFVQKRNQFKIAKCRLYLQLVQHIFAGGIPSLVAEVSSGIVMMIFNMVMLKLRGNIGVAAYGVVANLSLVVLAVYTGIAQGIQPLISRYFGAGNVEKIRRNFRYAVWTVIILSVMIYSSMYFGAEVIASIFNSENSPEMQLIAVDGIRLYFTAGVFAGFNIILSIYFAGTGRTGAANVVSVLRGFVLIIPITFGMAALWKVTGLWLAFGVTELVTATVGIWLLKKSQATVFLGERK